MSEAYRYRSTVDGHDYVRVDGELTWPRTGDGALWQCVRCGDGRAVAARQAHSAWHIRGRVGLPGQSAKPQRPELGDREAIDDE